MNSKRAKTFAMLCISLFFTSHCMNAQGTGVLGYWKEPGGSIIHVDSCGADVCATLAAISASAPSRQDGMNPDPGLRGRTLCGLQIGNGFQLKSSERAEDGHLYDPKSGKTYRGRMESHGDVLDLRGYVGISLLGRTEKWSRTTPVSTCRK